MAHLADALHEIDKAMKSDVNPFTELRKEREAEEALLPLATELGFTKEVPDDSRFARRYVKGNVVIWPIIDGWQCADLVPCTDPEFPKAKQYVNHRRYEDLETALRTEGGK